MAAVLHDVIDDTPTDPAAMAAAFGPRVAGLVAQVRAWRTWGDGAGRRRVRGVGRGDRPLRPGVGACGWGCAHGGCARYVLLIGDHNRACVIAVTAVFARCPRVPDS